MKAGFRGLRIAPLALVLMMALPAGQAMAGGENAGHIRNLSAHIDTYTADVEKLIGQVDGMVSNYAEKGSGAVDTDKLIDWWDDPDLKFHAAVESQFVPVYAAIWQRFYGVKQAIDDDKPVARVRAEQQALEAAIWQGLGVVRLAASNQKAGGGEKPLPDQVGTPAQEIEKILRNLDKVIVETAEGQIAEARQRVQDTYMQRFEGIEGMLIEQDAELVEGLEKDFNVTLPKLLEGGASVQKVSDAVAAMKEKLKRAEQLLEQAEKDKQDVF